MGEKLVNEFKTEIESIKTEKIRNFVIELLKKCSDMNATEVKGSGTMKI